jgi:hypothetical protein
MLILQFVLLYFSLKIESALAVLSMGVGCGNCSATGLFPQAMPSITIPSVIKNVLFINKYAIS